MWPLLNGDEDSSFSTDLFVRLSVSELLWGHEDERACLVDDGEGSKEEEEEYQSGEGVDDFFSDEDYGDFFKSQVRKKKSEKAGKY